MGFKEFLKPTKTKIFLLVLLMIIISLYSCWQFFSVACIQGCEMLSNGKWDCPSCPLCRSTDLVLFSLLLIIPNYFLACFLVYISRKIKNNLKELFVKRNF